MHASTGRQGSFLRRVAATLLLLAGFSLSPALGQAEELWSDSGFFVDMPAGFELKDGDGKTRFAFVDPQDGMEFDILAYEAGRFANVELLASETVKKLGSKGEIEPFSYEGRKAAFAELVFKLNGTGKRGFGIFVEGSRPGKTAPGAASKSFALLAYSDVARFDSYADFILSCLDAFSIDRAARRSPGPISQYLLSWPPERTETKLVKLPGGAEAELPWSAEEVEQELGTATREYKVLKAYAEHPILWTEAWGRFYRMVYRESSARLDRLALEISRVLPSDDPTESARRLLAWVQGFVYERDEKGIDFVPPLAAAYQGRGDCDARAVVMAVILERLGVDTVLMLSREYSHAMAAVDVPGGGQRFAFGGKKYLVAETTAKVGIGMIAGNQADWKKWLGVDLGK